MHYCLSTAPSLSGVAQMHLDASTGGMQQPGCSVQMQGRVHSITLEAEGIFLLDIRPVAGWHFPATSPGAHIDLHLPNGLVRSYSTINSAEDADRYLIAVKNEADGRGGSRFIHSELRVGQVLTVDGPRNNFDLYEDATHSVLIAGGIGITPIYSMVQQLERLGRSWELHYAASDRSHAAFAARLQNLQPHVHFYFNSDYAGDQPLDLRKLIANSRDDAHFYCCGPHGMLAAFETATEAVTPARVHVEYFSAIDAPVAEGGFEIVLQRSGLRCNVQHGETILDAVLKLGVDVPYCCMEGVCGSCEVAVLQGTPDHRDLILSKEEKHKNDRMMICCSGSKTDKLVIDL